MIPNADGFQRFWTAYPKKVGRLAAAKQWARIKPTSELVDQMLKTLAWQIESEQWQRGYIPHPTTWLSQGRWDDEPDGVPALPKVADFECSHEPRCDARWRCHVKTQIEREQRNDRKLRATGSE